MYGDSLILGSVTTRRIVVVAACLVLLYFGAGGAYLHHHNTGNATPCHICQSLHALRQGASTQGLIAAPTAMERFLTSSVFATPGDTFPSQRVGRAPPTV